MPDLSAFVLVPTASATLYLQQLCKHWAHHLPVELNADRGSIVFPKDLRGADDPGDARVVLYSLDDGLRIEIQATSMDQRERLKDVLARHLERFAFREAPLTFNWE